MSVLNCPDRLLELGRIYSELYGTKALEEARAYALVARSIGNSEESDLWMGVAGVLESGPAADPQVAPLPTSPIQRKAVRDPRK